MQGTPIDTRSGASRQASKAVATSSSAAVKHAPGTAPVGYRIVKPNPTPSATPPPSVLRAAVARGTQSTASTSTSTSTGTGTGTRGGSSRTQHALREAIDVDELYEHKYAIKGEDVVEAIDVGTFRQSVRAEKGKARERERYWEEGPSMRVPAEGAGVAAQQLHGAARTSAPQTVAGTGSATASAAVRVSSTSTSGPPRSSQGAGTMQHVEHPSIIAQAMDNMKAKRAAAAAQQQHAETPVHKRRRIDDPSPIMSPSKRPHTQQPVTAINKSKSGVLSAPHSSTSSGQGPPRIDSPKRKHPIRSHFARQDEPIVISDSEDSVENELFRKRAKSTSGARQASASGGARTQEQEIRSRPSTLHPVLPAKRKPEVIELFSSSDVEIMEDDNSPPPPKKKSKPTQSSGRQPLADITDNMDEYSLFEEGPVGYHSPAVESSESEDEGWDLNDPDRWEPMPDNRNKMLDSNIADKFNNLDINESPERVPSPIRYIPPNTSMSDPFPRLAGYTRGPPRFIWDKLALAANTVVPRRPRPFAHLPPSRVYIPPRDQDFGVHRLQRAFHNPSEYDPLRKAPGCISKIEQKGPWTVIASGSIGGLPDVLNETPHAYNGPGSLMTWNGHLDIPCGHQVRKTNPDRIKYYAVHDVKFHPMRQAFVSCGADRRVLYWTPNNIEEDPNLTDSDHYPTARHEWIKRDIKTFGGNGLPHELAFKPDSSLLAIGEKKVYLFGVGPESIRERASFWVHKPHEAHHVGSISWGSSSTANHLFASSEPDNEGVFTGIHRAYDLSKKSSLYTFDATEAGDTLCIRSDGESLALSTRGKGHKPMLRVYDIARQDKKATTKIVLDPYDAPHPNFEGEVNCSTFSPDGILLALARNDNQTHVYDVRFMSSGHGPLFVYKHTGECRSSSPMNRFGVVKAQWLQSARSRRLALVTGGDDGCVRCWDPQIAADDPKNGLVVAEALSDIGHFSIGNPFSEEHRLVVGDCNGEVYFFDSII